MHIIKQIIQEEYGGWMSYEVDDEAVLIGHSIKNGPDGGGGLAVTVDEERLVVHLEGSDTAARDAVRERIIGETEYSVG